MRGRDIGLCSPHQSYIRGLGEMRKLERTNEGEMRKQEAEDEMS